MKIDRFDFVKYMVQGIDYACEPEFENGVPVRILKHAAGAKNVPDCDVCPMRVDGICLILDYARMAYTMDKLDDEVPVKPCRVKYYGDGTTSRRWGRAR